MDIISRSISSIFDTIMAIRENVMVSTDQLIFYGIALFFGLILALAFILSANGLLRSDGRKKKLPPEPRPLSVVGNFFSLETHPAQVFARLAKQYGNIMSLFIGSVRVVIVSNANMAKELFSISDASFASRLIHNLVHTAAKNLNFGTDDGTTSMFICIYSPRVREARQLCINELFTLQKLEMGKSKLMEHVQRMVAALKEVAMGAGNKPMEMRPVICEFNPQNSCQTVFNGF